MLTKEVIEKIHDDLWKDHANIEFSTDKRTEDRTVNSLCRTAIKLHESVERLNLQLSEANKALICEGCGCIRENCPKIVPMPPALSCCPDCSHRFIEKRVDESPKECCCQPIGSVHAREHCPGCPVHNENPKHEDDL